MHVILEIIETPRCEGRLIPRDLFDAIDTLESMVLHGHPSQSGHHSPPRLAEWGSVIRKFGEYYHLAGVGPITVDRTVYAEVAAQYRGAQHAELFSARDQRDT
jgi:hypothetical protein